MRKLRKLETFVMTLILCFGIMAAPAFAASLSQDGLEITLTTDKESYTQDEEIVATLMVTNTNDTAVTDVSLEGLIPDGYALADGTESVKQVDTLEAGETVSLTVTYVSDSSDTGDETDTGDSAGTGDETDTGDSAGTDDETDTGDSTDTDTSSSGSEDGGETTAATSDSTGDTSVSGGDSRHIVLWVVLLLTGCGIVALIAQDKKRGKRFLSLFLCAALLASIGIQVPAYGEESGTGSTQVSSAQIETTVLVDGSEVTIQGVVSYTAADESQSQYTVTFETNGGSEVAAQQVEAGATAAEPTAPEKEGFVFAGWYTDDTYTIVYDFSAAVTEDITLYAAWSAAEGYHAVSFELYIDDHIENLSAFGVQAVKDGDLAVRPDDPAADLGDFAGWFTTSAFETEFDFETQQITEDTVIYAKWDIDTTDSDGDGIYDVIEEYLGTDPYQSDSDGDGLPDLVELEIGTDPLNADTDGDGISDYDADEDQDTLSNGYEVSIGTSPIKEDSDYDGLSDSDEINVYGTDPLLEDTDGDGAGDGWEVQNGFDPLEYNSSFAVVIEADEPDETVPVTAGVETDLAGDQVVSLDVDQIDVTDNWLLSPQIPGYLGQAYEFTVDGTIEEATITFCYDTSLGTIGDDFQPRIYYYNEETQELEELEDQTVTEGMVSASTTHFSTYILLNKIAFDEVWETEIKAPEENATEQKLDIVFVIDASGSMSYDSSPKNDADGIRMEVAKKMVEKFSDADRGAVIKFASGVTVLQGFTSDKDILYSAIDSIGSYGRTAMYDAVKKAINLFEAEDYSAEDTMKIIIVLTDGIDNASSATLNSVVSAATSEDITIYSIGLGSSLDEASLVKLAESTGGSYYYASVADELYEIFEKIEDETIDYTTDTNGDGISDYYTNLIYEGKLALSTGSLELSGIDLNYDADGNLSDDYDGDGLKNGEELEIVEKGDRVYLKMNSNPLLLHSDGDGIDDYIETLNGTDPMKYQASKAYADLLIEDKYYYYETKVEDLEGSWLLTADTAFLSAIYGIWNKDELYRDIMIDYFSTYGDATYLENLEAEETKQSMIKTLSDIVSNLKKVFSVRSEIKNIYKLISTINGTYDADAINYLLLYTYSDTVAEIYEIYPDLGYVTVTSYSMSEESLYLINMTEVGKVVSKVGKGLSYAAYGLDIADTIAEFSKVSANLEAFEANMDILEWIVDNSSDDHAADAASAIISKMSGEFGSEIAAVVGDLAEVAGKEAISALSKANIYVLAVVAVRDGIDLITGISKDLKQQYQMVAYERLTAASNALLEDVISAKGSYYYVTSDDLATFRRLLINVAQMRILGEKKYCEYAEYEGVLGWFISNDDTEEKIDEQIEAIKRIVAELGLEISGGL